MFPGVVTLLDAEETEDRDRDRITEACINWKQVLLNTQIYKYVGTKQLCPSDIKIELI